MLSFGLFFFDYDLDGRLDLFQTNGHIEEAINQVAELLQDKMQPDGLAIVMEADHYCMQWRGVKDMNSKMTNSIMRGSFLKDPNLRREFLSLMATGRGQP